MGKTSGGIPRNISRIKYTQTNRILMIIDIDIFLQAEDFRVADICAVDEGTEE